MLEHCEKCGGAVHHNHADGYTTHVCDCPAIEVRFVVENDSDTDVLREEFVLHFDAELKIEPRFFEKFCFFTGEDHDGPFVHCQTASRSGGALDLFNWLESLNPENWEIIYADKTVVTSTVPLYDLSCFEK